MSVVSAMRSRGAMIAAVGVLTMALVGYLRSSRGATAFAPGDLLLLADVTNETADVGLDRTLRAAATVALQQSGRVRLYPRSRLSNIYQLIGIANRDTTLSYTLAQEVAERDHVRFVLGLSVENARSGYRVVARLADVRLHRDIAAHEAPARTQQELVEALDVVVRSLRRTLGESRREVAERWAPLPRVTTGSLEALRSFADGSDAWLKGEYPRATELFLRAVDLDTGFAMALGALGAANYYNHNRADGERYFAAALARSERLTELERFVLLRRLATYRGNIDSSLVVSARIAERFPSAATWADYATDLMNAWKLEQAVAAFGRTIAIDSTAVLPWVNLATTYARLRQPELAVQSYARVGALDSVALYRNNINHEYGQQLVHLGRLADAETLYNRMADGPRIQDRALGLRSLGFLYYWEGRLDESADAFTRATSATQQMKAPLSEGRNHLLLAMAYRAANRRADAEVEITRALALDTASSFEPTMLALVAYACQQSARPRDLESVMTLLRTRVDAQNQRDRSAAAFAEATLRMVRHQPDSALVYLRRASDFPFGGPWVMLMASAFDAVHQPDSAKTVLLTLIDASAFGVEGQAEQMHAPLVLGDLLLQSGDTAAAVQRYKDVVARWRNSPIDAPDLVAAKTRLLALNTRTSRGPH